MRYIAVLMILAGLGLAFGYPLYQMDHSGNEFESVRIFDRSKGGWQNGWTKAEVSIELHQNPVQIRLSGEIIGSPQTPAKSIIPITIDLEGPEGKALTDLLYISIGEDSDKGLSQNRKISRSIPQFDVIADGLHHLTVSMSQSRDINLLWLDAGFFENVDKPDFQYRPIGLGLAAFGFLLYLIGMRRKKKQRSSQKKTRRWGRR